MWCSRFLHRRYAAALVGASLLFLSITTTANAEAITSHMIVSATNAERVENGETSLALDPELSAIAAEKLNDMFARGYFAHTAPTGETAGAIARGLEYEYALLGENLAMGWYDSAEEIVTAWMASPGHRKNILRDTFTSIGVAVGTGMFEGEETVMAVQIFAKPMTECRKPSDELKASIAAGETFITKIASLMRSYARAGAGTSGMRVVLDQVGYLLALFEKDLSNKVASYNEQMKAYNACTSA